MERKLNRKEREMRATVSRKIFEGRMLTEGEFVIACEAGYYDVKFSDREEAYKNLKARHYKSPSLEGYICNQHPTATIKRATREEAGEICGFGIHADQLDPLYLTPENRAYLGEEFLKRIPVFKGEDTSGSITLPTKPNIATLTDPETLYEATDLCLDCANTTDCEDGTTEHHPIAQSAGHYAVTKCPHFHPVEGCGRDENGKILPYRKSLQEPKSW